MKEFILFHCRLTLSCILLFKNKFSGTDKNVIFPIIPYSNNIYLVGFKTSNEKFTLNFESNCLKTIGTKFKSAFVTNNLLFQY
jgi:hypothetical protein